MTPLSLFYPVSPHTVTRGWGVEDELYAEFGFKKHNGVDLALSVGQEIRAPFDCTVTLVGNHPKGSGLFVCVLSNAQYDFPDGARTRVELSFMHLSGTPVRKGMRLGVGAVLAYGGSTGKSTGPHVHIAPKRVKKGLLGYRDYDRNDANNTFDPTAYWNGAYATLS
ncbi:M23 family metallopeptidase [Patescibacteria group bacterium]|nr:M23 family metallopeptidase [Patescibacteria group bacterium]MBU1501021.1 M23 family metallopeptidase [Patescibacteria group bacterium]MBU2080651.1 M23 family metallopeptidase [Patescibacteria group bacterium]MBU2124274.1 M23 family metallopeptidase [Patescibacteria group bacterium]MBU2194400.1 M23 family metallopeptidase [Patescibacteria group bacterium]